MSDGFYFAADKHIAYPPHRSGDMFYIEELALKIYGIQNTKQKSTCLNAGALILR